MLAAAAPTPHTSPSLAVRAWFAGALLAVFGLRPTPRRARWLATVTAHAAAQQGEGTAVAEPARRRLASVTDGAQLSHRAGRESSPRVKRHPKFPRPLEWSDPRPLDREGS
jgi:hypothetical protein